MYQLVSMTVRLCVLCRVHPVDPVWRPFCSERCKLQDLARWADGRYRVAGEPATTDTDDARQTDKARGARVRSEDP
jgi:endogenous inhibitor of DNA gyrase (YacG/DUF329 family)